MDLAGQSGEGEEGLRVSGLGRWVVWMVWQ